MSKRERSLHADVFEEAAKGEQPWIREEKLLNTTFSSLRQEVLLGNVLIGHDVFMPYGNLIFQHDILNGWPSLGLIWDHVEVSGSRILCGEALCKVG